MCGSPGELVGMQADTQTLRKVVILAARSRHFTYTGTADLPHVGARPRPGPLFNSLPNAEMDGHSMPGQAPVHRTTGK